MSSDAQCRVIAEQLTEATRAGDLAGAYRALQGLTPEDAEKVALQAGFSVISKRNKAEFYTHLQSQIARATRARVDGFALLRNVEDRKS
ncbi:MAG: hypothetical protein VB141_11940 [Burkholderia gladioli]